jgi:hypothetical protein
MRTVFFLIAGKLDFTRTNPSPNSIEPLVLLVRIAVRLYLMACV